MPIKQCDIKISLLRPYMFLCTLNKQIEVTETESKCESFKDTGYVFTPLEGGE